MDYYTFRIIGDDKLNEGNKKYNILKEYTMYLLWYDNIHKFKFVINYKRNCKKKNKQKLIQLKYSIFICPYFIFILNLMLISKYLFIK